MRIEVSLPPLSRMQRPGKPLSAKAILLRYSADPDLPVKLAHLDLVPGVQEAAGGAGGEGQGEVPGQEPGARAAGHGPGLHSWGGGKHKVEGQDSRRKQH